MPGQVLPILEESADRTRFGKLPLPHRGKGLLIPAPTGPALSHAVVLTALTDLHIFELFPRGGFPCGLAGKESTRNARDPGSIPGSGRSPGEGKGYPLQYSGLENSTDCIVHRVAKSWTRLSDFHSLTHSLTHLEVAKTQPTPSSQHWSSRCSNLERLNEHFRNVQCN